jgi:hypothetical protein
MKYLKYFFILGIFLASCNRQQKDNEQLLLDQYFIDRGMSDVEKESFMIEDGLYLIRTGFSTPETLDSEAIERGDSIKLFYKGYLLSDKDIIFEETSYNDPAIYVYMVDHVIQGWEKAIALLQEDQSAIIIMRSDHAYKGEQIGLIPPWSSLIFEVRILEIF